MFCVYTCYVAFSLSFYIGSIGITCHFKKSFESLIMTTGSDITSCEVNGDGKNIIEEPLLKENPNRYVLFPIKDGDVSTCVYNHQESQLNSLFLAFIPKIWLMYKKAMASFWTGKSVSVSIVLSYEFMCSICSTVKLTTSFDLTLTLFD